MNNIQEKTPKRLVKYPKKQVAPAEPTELVENPLITIANTQLANEITDKETAESIESITPQPLLPTQLLNKIQIVNKAAKPPKTAKTSLKSVASKVKSFEINKKRNQWTCSLSDDEELHVKTVLDFLITEGFCENKADFLRKAIDYVINENAADTILKKSGKTICFPFVNNLEPKLLKGSLMPSFLGFATCKQ